MQNILQFIICRVNVIKLKRMPFFYSRKTMWFTNGFTYFWNYFHCFITRLYERFSLIINIQLPLGKVMVCKKWSLQFVQFCQHSLILKKAVFVPECVFGKQVRELGSQWIPDLGVPIGVLYCMKCECVPVSRISFAKY